MVVVAVIQVLYVHVQEADVDVAASIHSYSPVIVSIIGVCPGIQGGCYLTKVPGHINTIHCGAEKRSSFELVTQLTYMFITGNQV